MYEVTYHRASSTDEAAQFAGNASDPKFIAGGQTLLPTLKQRLANPSDLIDLRHVEDMKGISVRGAVVNIGAGTVHAEVAGSSELADACPGLAYLAANIGDPHVRNMGTLGGSISNNDPSACYPAAMLALSATIHTNQREIAADDFFTGLFETALEDNEIVTGVQFTAPSKSGYGKFANPASRYAMTGVFLAQDGDGSVRVAVTGAGMDGVFRWTQAEEALSANFSPDALNDCLPDVDDMMEDIHASAEYRANLVKVMAQRAVAQAG
jgi:carbon-monoxide dehydrogenase medium subunit